MVIIICKISTFQIIIFEKFPRLGLYMLFFVAFYPRHIGRITIIYKGYTFPLKIFRHDFFKNVFKYCMSLNIMKCIINNIIN